MHAIFLGWKVCSSCSEGWIMVKLVSVESPVSGPPAAPIGVLQSLVLGFENIASRPILLIPPLLLDLFIWLGPRLTIPAIFEDLASLIAIPVGSGSTLIEQANFLRSTIQELSHRVNLVSIISSSPVGMPSLISSKQTVETPFGAGREIELISPFMIVFAILLMIVLGQALGAQYHIWIAKQIAPGKRISARGQAILRMVFFALLIMFLSIIVGLGFSLFALLFAILLPLLGLLVGFLGFSFVFWAFVYLIFTPHGIIRYRLGVIRAMTESVTLVRLNLLPVVGFLSLAYGISWITNRVWLLPDEKTWFIILAIAGHAFVSTTLLTASYVFYQDRRDMLFSLQESKVETGGNA